MDLQKIFMYYEEHRGGILGILSGSLTAILILLVGFWRVIFIALFAGIGYYIGKRIHEDKDYLKNLLDRVLPPGTYR